jgi:hypothetical protein
MEHKHNHSHQSKSRSSSKSSSKETLATDWSLISGRIPHMNDPRQDNKPFKITMNGTNENLLTTSTTVPVANGGVITTTIFPNFANLAVCFDQYRITSAEVWIIPQATNNSALMKTVVDYDNASVTATTAYFDSYTNCHTTTLANGHYRRFVPHIALAAYSGAFTSYSNVKMQWIDCVSSNVQHFGFKTYCDTTASGAIVLDLIVRAKFEFRNPI